MMDFKGWSDRAVRLPLACAVAVVACLQLTYLLSLGRNEYQAQKKRLDRVVEAASLGIQQENRPLVETSLLAALNDADVRRVALCRDGVPVVAYPPASENMCSYRSGLVEWTVRRRAVGQTSDEFVFVIDRMRTFRTAVCLLGITLVLGAAILLVLSGARRRFLREVVQPLLEGLNRREPLDITELEDLRARVQGYNELRRKEAVSQALFALSTQVAHDIRSPLAVLDAISDRAEGLPENDRTILRGALARVRGIADSLLSENVTACRIAPLPAVQRADPQRLADLVNSIVTEKRIQYGGPGLDLQASADDRCCSRVDAMDLKRVLSNLIDNAVEALPGGQGRVAVELRGAGNEVLIAIRDNGKGVAPEVLESLGRAGVTYGKKGGTGLGLAHAKACAASWEGSLSFESKVGEGTVVTLRLPAAASPERIASCSSEADLLDAVLVDDDELVRKLWISRAKDHGKRFRAFPSGGECLEAATHLDKRTPIYVDHELAGRERGPMLARDLAAMGFETIYLATGQSPEAFGPMPWITKIVGKHAPWG